MKIRMAIKTYTELDSWDHIANVAVIKPIMNIILQNGGKITVNNAEGWLEIEIPDGLLTDTQIDTIKSFLRNLPDYIGDL
jgi:hypothetical protein